MGAFIPGMDEHNAVNNSDGFSTGFLGNKSNNNFNPVPPQGYMGANQQDFSNNSQVPVGNFQDMSSVDSQMQNNGINQIQIVEAEQKKKLSMPSLPVNNLNNTSQMNMINNSSSFNNQKTVDSPSSVDPNTSKIPINIVAGNENNNKPNLTPPPFNESEGFKKASDSTPETNNLSIDAKINEIMNKKENNSNIGNIKENKSNKIVHIVALSIIGVLVVFIILIATGVIKHGKKEEVVEQESTYVDKDKEYIEGILTKLNNGCNNLSTSGSYGAEKISSDSECDTLVCFIDNNVICQNSICMIAVDEKVYTRVCSTGESRVANRTDFQAKLNLDLLCEILYNSPELNGNYKDDYGTCNNYECITTVDGKDYDSKCQENS